VHSPGCQHIRNLDRVGEWIRGGQTRSVFSASVIVGADVVMVRRCYAFHFRLLVEKPTDALAHLPFALRITHIKQVENKSLQSVSSLLPRRFYLLLF